MMATSILLAKIMGIYLIVVYLSALMNKKLMPSLIKETTGNTALAMMGGAMALIVGLLVVLNHNVWTAGWMGLVTLLGWIALIKGALIIIAPQQVLKWTAKFNEGMLTVMSVVMLIVGIVLTYFGFTT